ncbi:MAG: holo-ACP synthase [Oscillospiraceae bacterium]|nr:holo-ACP synthase [Oscillospiraceae bacterium]
MKILHGIDIVDIDRISSSLKRKNFLTRIFSEEEIKLFKSKNFSHKTIAGNFASKEAFFKAIGTGIIDFSFKYISILRNINGSPYIKIDNYLKNKININLSNTSISISHEKKYAIASIIIII